ncbi:uncharacterized protein OCT59_001021 [Rhizophagus irregularis]|uniref:BTB domain-containing protein n=2 Tax=Rhizophagus irregularis TaxID=588596 RepID=A0A015L8Y6_RHIIW|nr:hypothetical protein GLOIN_2v1780554 [Rhizophagus irregularis DAOM 181602=DAOM 197198]EXX69006.1 hypothetical protein RirG_099800 [Rhizophagus irregularis DAOM 197198w]POG66400.1 hypothetical protein GLOIN_2v1780554 [Rhizophagus irregularis DAOM 181602=DAOM 197198]UZN99754.1 hypothetical protein OCT59_001021 [Rhizophagus irregularis]CAG8590979.1 1824_t:CDS:1 [Rhizophagus irregularis]|eukprot:XP_025173266.1 hypothetical protein GLOIN_2v1780554 [Rhizophagus irregularis DAOM 181602=DAOM 197198]
MTKGYSLKQDLRLLINNPKYSDIEILCEDEKKLYGCRAILAARSEVFDRLLYNEMKESHETQISFPKIHSNGMKIILEYIYTGSVKKESLTKDNTVEAFYAADYFQLLELQDFIIKIIKNTLEMNYAKNYSPELLSKVAEIIPLTEDNILANLLVKEVASITLNDVNFDRLSIAGLKYLLSFTREKKDIPFATREYEVFRYSAILAARQVSDDAYRTLKKKLPTLKQMESCYDIEFEFSIDHQKVTKELEPFIKFIDFNQINAQTIADIIEPLKIVPDEIIFSVYRHKALLNNLDLNNIRGIPIYRIKESDLIWDESACGPKLIIEDNGKVVRAPNDLNSHQNVRAKMILENKGIYEWDIIFEKVEVAWVGVCASENFNYEKYAGDQPSVVWVISTGGNYRNKNYCPNFGNDAKITVHLDMNKRACTFTINGIKYLETLEHDGLPEKLYPVVSLSRPGRIRIQAHQKNLI